MRVLFVLASAGPVTSGHAVLLAPAIARQSLILALDLAEAWAAVRQCLRQGLHSRQGGHVCIVMCTKRGVIVIPHGHNLFILPAIVSIVHA